jgi:MFS family permease
LSRRFLVGPFLCGCACWILANGTVTLLPLYAMERGASPSGGGLFLAFAYLCLALGTATGAVLPKGFHHRRALIMGCGILASLLSLLVSRTTGLVGFAAASGASWFLAGSVVTQATILVGLAAPGGERGTALGILGMTSGVGSILGGLGVGWLAVRFGFSSVFLGISAVCLLMVAGGFLSVESGGPLSGPLPQASRAPARAGGSGSPTLTSKGRQAVVALGFGFFLLLASNLLMSVTNSTAILGRALRMDQYGFSKLTISVTQSMSGVVSLTVPLVLGWLSDKIGRRWILVGSYLVVSAGLLVLASAQAFWQFGLFAVLIGFLSVCLGLGPAFVLDVVPPGSAARGVSLYQTTFWAGNIIGTAALGLAYERLGTTAPVIAASFFPLAGIIFLLLIRRRSQAEGGREIFRA